MATRTRDMFLFLWICIFFTTVTAIPWPLSMFMRLLPPTFQACPVSDLSQNECFQLVHTEYNCTTVVKNKCSPRGKRGIRISHTVSGPCHSRKTTICKDFTCQRLCCNGWKRDTNGRCTLNANAPVQECHNGGTPSGTKCTCRQGFKGTNCETPICEPKCMNGGVCDYNKTLTKPVCVCNRNFTGAFCEKVKCEVSCGNDGICIADNGTAKCLCPPGYTGQYCQSVSIGSCNATLTHADVHVMKKCNDSVQCKDWEVCCRPSFVKHGVCIVRDQRQTCTMDGKTFRVGQNITVGCEVCSCIQSNAIEGQVVCSDLCASNKHYTNMENFQKCCDGKPADYIKPEFLNCPNRYEVVAIDTWGNASYGYLTKNYIKAVDWEGQRLHVRLSATKFQACNTFRCLDHSVMAVTEPDHYGLQSHCEFKLRVIDTMRPVFTSCPASIYGFPNENIYWPRPQVIDNVGVAALYLEQPYRNGSSFDSGTTILTYRAEDYKGNAAKCLFIIRIFHTDTEAQEMPDELKERSYVSPGLIAGASVVGVLTITLLILAVILIKICKLKRQAASVIRRNRNDVPPTYNEVNQVNEAIFKLDPPPYEIAAKDKLPEYKAKDDPPNYNEVLEESRDDEAHASPVGSPVYENDMLETRRAEDGKMETTI